MNNKKDGHVHSHYCPHGSSDNFDEYLEKAIRLGIKEITFTEHMNMPIELKCEGMDKNFINSTYPSMKSIDEYFQDVKRYKNKYKDRIKINLGLEVDYLEGYEKFTTELLNKYGVVLEDSILSVHIGLYDGKYYCFDCIESFEILLKNLGSVEKIYDLYYNTLLKAIKSDLGKFKPKRIGHPTLVRIFNKKYPLEYKNNMLFEEIIKEIKERDYEIDYNTSGLRKEFCREVYPSGKFYKIALKNNVKMIYGSDSHFAKDVGYEFE